MGRWLADWKQQRGSVCMQGDYGPFQPNFPADVPLWFAMYLHRHKKCKIEAPAWMSIDRLQRQYHVHAMGLSRRAPDRYLIYNACLAELYDQERSMAAIFQPVPYHYIEISRLLLMFAKDSFGSDFHRVGSLNVLV